MDTPTDRSREMLTIMENLSALQGGNFNPEAAQMEDMEPLAMPPHLEAANRAAAAASASKPASLDKLNTKPKRPLSAYNIFFKHEREKLVSDAPDVETPVTLESLKVDPTRKPNKRRHRKSHGKIGFADLARTIAEKWKSLDAEQRTVYEACAAKEKERYQKEVTEWKATKKLQSVAQETAMKNQAALNHSDFLYNSSRSTMQEGFSNRDLAGMRSLDAGGDWSSRTMTDGLSMRNSQEASLQDPSSSAGGVQDPRDYLKITQQVIDMARASLSLPLFANLGRTGILDDATARSLLGDQPSSLRMNNTSQPSSFLRSNDMESSQLTNGALLNVPFGNDPMASLDSESLYQNQLMQSLDSNPQGYFNNQRSSIREELESRAFMNQQYRQSEWDSANQDYPDYGNHTTQDQLLQSLRNQTSRQGNQDGLLSSLRNQASREAEEQQELLRSLRNQASRQTDEGSLLSNLRSQVSRQAEEQDSLLSNLRNQASRPADGEELLNRYNRASRQPEGDELVNMINASLKDHF